MNPFSRKNNVPLLSTSEFINAETPRNEFFRNNLSHTSVNTTKFNEKTNNSVAAPVNTNRYNGRTTSFNVGNNGQRNTVYWGGRRNRKSRKSRNRKSRNRKSRKSRNRKTRRSRK